MCLDNHTPDVFGLWETFLNNNVDYQMVQHKNYVTERKDRLSGKSGGGILCYVRENIQYKRRSDLETDLELIWLEIFFSGSKNLLVCFFYRPPDSKSSWLDMFSDHLENLYDECKGLLLLGDMNINMLNSDDINSASPHKLIGPTCIEQRKSCTSYHKTD